MFKIPKLTWYEKNELSTEFNHVETVEEITPPIENVTSDTPEYPVNIDEHDKVATDEISEDDKPITDEFLGGNE